MDLVRTETVRLVPPQQGGKKMKTLRSRLARLENVHANKLLSFLEEKE
jgi:hypothetical protein